MPRMVSCFFASASNDSSLVVGVVGGEKSATSSWSQLLAVAVLAAAVSLCCSSNSIAGFGADEKRRIKRGFTSRRAISRDCSIGWADCCRDGLLATWSALSVPVRRSLRPLFWAPACVHARTTRRDARTHALNLILESTRTATDCTTGRPCRWPGSSARLGEARDNVHRRRCKEDAPAHE